MKTIYVITLMLLVFTSCASKPGENAQKVTFGIYEIVNPSDLPASFSDSLATVNLRPATETEQPIIGYIKTDSLAFLGDFVSSSYMLLNTAYTVDKDNNYHTVVAVKPEAVINLSHIKKTKAEGNRVTIYFNLQGANLWAEVTRNNKGKVVAFVIDNKLYDMPVINSEIRLGLAVISNLENEASALYISEALNSSIPH
jgi:hypothetical protein